MGSARDELEARVERFVDDIEALVRRATVEVVQEAFTAGGEPGKTSGEPEVPRRRPKPRRGSSSARRKSRARYAPRTAKTAGEKARLEKAMVDFIAANPGAKMQDLSAAIGRRSEVLQPLMRRLLASGAVRKTGERNRTQYFPAG
ncbi:MAG TPA: hypothetical protein RMH99_00655 [Sandaracinaceae bacterium LLY-WYZ-13_1]|nr:hypothetical protein [Sandaracinaceae bacterium LLY-WYZ-13_1]